MLKAVGVGLYVKSNLITTRRLHLEFDPNDSENLFIDIRLSSKTVVVIDVIRGVARGVIYGHPTSNFNKFQEQLLQTFQKKQDYLLCGGFNINLLKKRN